jgi:hypothetical protein
MKPLKTFDVICAAINGETMVLPIEAWSRRRALHLAEKLVREWRAAGDPQHYALLTLDGVTRSL